MTIQQNRTNSKLTLCHECSAKVRMAFQDRELAELGSIHHTTCGHCRKQRYCMDYEMRRKV